MRLKNIKYVFFTFCLTIYIFNAVSCGKLNGNIIQDSEVVSPALPVKPSARPLAILKTGSQPLWFQLTEDGPVHLESIEDAVFSAAFIPWTLALHVRFFFISGDGVIMAVNRDGFLKIAPNAPSELNTEGLALYRFSGGGYWKQYTVGSLLLYNYQPAALLYIDDRFLDSNAPVPSPRIWTFNMDSNNLFPLILPALETFPSNEGWEVNTLRLGSDGYWYFRVMNKTVSNPEMRMLRTPDLSNAGVVVSLDDFLNSAPQKTVIDDPILPPLPVGYVYTGEAVMGNNIFACWEEQQDYSIGAAGFMVMMNPAVNR